MPVAELLDIHEYAESVSSGATGAAVAQTIAASPGSSVALDRAAFAGIGLGGKNRIATSPSTACSGVNAGRIAARAATYIDGSGEIDAAADENDGCTSITACPSVGTALAT